MSLEHQQQIGNWEVKTEVYSSVIFPSQIPRRLYGERLTTKHPSYGMATLDNFPYQYIDFDDYQNHK
jgi:hypothetical protein